MGKKELVGGKDRRNADKARKWRSLKIELVRRTEIEIEGRRGKSLAERRQD